MRFWGQFRNGLATKVLRNFAPDPFPYLNEDGKKKMRRAHSDLLRKPSKPPLVVAASATVLRGQPGRNPGDNGDTTGHLSGRSVRVLAFGLAFGYSASRMIAVVRYYGGTGNTGTRNGE
jgi:hypothetical protein